MSLVSDYASELHRELAMFATWPPAQAMALGDYGVIEDGVFGRRGNVRDLGIAIDETQGDSMDSFEYKSAGKIEVSAVAAVGQSEHSPARASKRVTFASKHSVFLSVAECVYWTIKNHQEVESGVLDAHRTGPWLREWTIVTGLMTAASTTVLVSSEANASIEVQLEAGVLTATLAGASANLKVSSEKNIGFQLVGSRGARPLLTLSRIARRYAPGWPFPAGSSLRRMGASGTTASSETDELALTIVERP